MSDALNQEIQEYQFVDLNTREKPKESIEGQEISSFQLEDLKEGQHIDRTEEKKILRVERKLASEGQFRISPIVKKHRGIAEQEREDQANRIQDLVDKKFSLVEEKAYKIGRDEGIEEGKKEIYEQLRSEVDEKIELLSEMVNEVLGLKEQLLNEQRLDIYGMLKNLVKWITLKELSQDDAYLERLLEKLIQEIETQDNLLIQVNKNHFDKMPKVLERVEAKIGELKNVRVEVDYDISDKGLNIESHNGIIQGTLEEQFDSLDKLFESVGLKSDE